MRSILRAIFLASATFSLTAMADFNATENTDGQDPDHPAAGLSLRTPTDLGCFSSPGSMFDMGIYQFQSSGWCQALCVRLSKQYFSNVNGTNCFCGDSAPSSQYSVDESNCQTETCSGIDTAKCGGTNYWEVYNSGFRNGDPTGSASITIPKPTYTYMGPGSAATSSSSSMTQAATVVVTQAATATPTLSSSTPSSGPNTAAIAAGVVVAVVLLAAIAGGVFFYLRRQKQQALIEEQRRHEMMTNFVTAEKPPGSGYTSPDARLDPSLMFSRRLSDGSIRDNEDYSRRILKVANPDD